MNEQQAIDKLKKRIISIEESLAQSKAMLVLFELAKQHKTTPEQILKDLKEFRELQE